jgi:hypothetical protein
MPGCDVSPVLSMTKNKAGGFSFPGLKRCHSLGKACALPDAGMWLGCAVFTWFVYLIQIAKTRLHLRALQLRLAPAFLFINLSERVVLSRPSTLQPGFKTI